MSAQGALGDAVKAQPMPPPRQGDAPLNDLHPVAHLARQRPSTSIRLDAPVLRRGEAIHLEGQRVLATDNNMVGAFVASGSTPTPRARLLACPAALARLGRQVGGGRAELAKVMMLGGDVVRGYGAGVPAVVGIRGGLGPARVRIAAVCRRGVWGVMGGMWGEREMCGRGMERTRAGAGWPRRMLSLTSGGRQDGGQGEQQPPHP